MKNLVLKIGTPIILLASIFIYSCSKDDPKQEEEEQQKKIEIPAEIAKAAAAVADDFKSGGVYKGSLLGSTGSVKVILQSNMKSIFVIFDGETRTLTTADLNNWTSGQAITNAVFTSGDWKVVFAVSANGFNPQIVATIPGHTVSVAIVKETAGSPTEAFEGTTTAGTKQNTINFVVKGDTSLTGVIKVNDGKSYTLKGVMVNKQINASATTALGKITTIGTLTNGIASGTFTEKTKVDTATVEIKGTWTTNKTL